MLNLTMNKHKHIFKNKNNFLLDLSDFKTALVLLHYSFSSLRKIVHLQPLNSTSSDIN